jgi:hypothetical protein
VRCRLAGAFTVSVIFPNIASFVDSVGQDMETGQLRLQLDDLAGRIEALRGYL